MICDSLACDGDFENGGRAFQHMGPETEKPHEAYVAILVRGKFRLPCVAAADDDGLWSLRAVIRTVTR